MGLTEIDRELTWEQIATLLPEDLSGWRTLHIGSGIGGLSSALAGRGALVTGIDCGSEQGALTQVYDLASDWDFYDLVLFTGVFERLRYPALGLEIAVQKARRLFLFQSCGHPDAVPLLRAAGLCVLMQAPGEIYLCEPDPSALSAENAVEYQAAAGLKARLTKTLKFKHCWVNSSLGYTETCYHDGTHVPAVPEDSEQYRINAAQFGYGNDTAALSREHEILHTFLAEALGFGASPTLWAVAHGQQGNVAPIWEQEEEEAWTLAFQTYLHGGLVSAPLTRFTEAGWDLQNLRETARRLLK